MYSVFFGKPKAAVAEEDAATATESLEKDNEDTDAKMPEGDVLETNDVELKIDEQTNEHPKQKDENTEDAVTKVPAHEIDKIEIEVKKDIPNDEFEDEKNDVEKKEKEDKREEEEEVEEDDKLKVSPSTTDPGTKTDEKEEDEDEGDEKALRHQVHDEEEEAMLKVGS